MATHATATGGGEGTGQWWRLGGVACAWVMVVLFLVVVVDFGSQSLGLWVTQGSLALRGASRRGS